MSSLNAFLYPIQAENKEVVVSQRFVENGKVMPFVIPSAYSGRKRRTDQKAYEEGQERK